MADLEATYTGDHFWVNRFTHFNDDLTISPIDINGLQVAPITSFYESIKNIRQLIPQFGLMINLIKQQHRPVSELLSEDEILAIMLYTLEWKPSTNSVHFRLNQALESKDSEKLNVWLPYFRLLLHCLRKISTNEPKEVFRVIRKNLSSYYSDGDREYAQASILSCTTNKQLLQELGDQSKHLTIIKMRSRSAIDVSQYSVNPEEREHIILPSCRFKVISIEKKSKKRVMIELEEIENISSNITAPITEKTEEAQYDAEKTLNDINILLLGETGVGKTTFLNAMMNYLYYPSLDEALENELKYLIPASFSVVNPDDYEQLSIKIGKNDPNEECDIGKSATQGCRSYLFNLKSCLLRLIDGPGIGDTRGYEKDRENIQHILDYVNQYPHLNGICLLLKSSTVRLDVSLRYCLKELFLHLHNNAKTNIMFIFTGAREIFFRGSGVNRLINKMLDEIESQDRVRVPFNDENTFFFDNESFRFLALKNAGYNFMMDRKDEYIHSWQKSSEELVRLFKKVIMCGAHITKETVSLNEVLQKIDLIAEPLLEITKMVEENITLASEHREQLDKRKSKETMYELKQVSVRRIPLAKPCLTCTSEKCTKIVRFNNQDVSDFLTICKEPLIVKNLVSEMVGHPTIKYCSAIDKQGKCKKCLCDWSVHKQIVHRLEWTSKKIPITHDDSSSELQSLIETIEGRIQTLKAEKEILQKTSAQLIRFVRKNCVISYNDAMIEYLQLHLSDLRIKKDENFDPIQKIEKAIQECKNRKELFESNPIDYMKNESLQQQPTDIEIETVSDLMNKLMDLPINGPTIREQITQKQMNRIEQIVAYEIIVPLPQCLPNNTVLSKLNDMFNDGNSG